MIPEVLEIGRPVKWHDNLKKALAQLHKAVSGDALPPCAVATQLDKPCNQRGADLDLMGLQKEAEHSALNRRVQPGDLPGVQSTVPLRPLIGGACLLLEVVLVLC
ncbi:MAG: hypothetical protein UGF45_06310, partial [Massilioclostridium sp.]|nr:hypothetical protein [Massilioclostridium sp.]